MDFTLSLVSILAIFCIQNQPAKSSQFLEKEGEVQLGNFLKTSQGHKVQKNGTLLSTITTTSEDQCLVECVLHPQCLSVNIVSLEDSTQLQCELLNWSGTNISKYLVPNSKSYHMQLQTKACSPNPCENGGECTAEAGGSNYTCTCTAKYAGRNCEKKCILFDFETGRLDGWTLTGTAFNNQPTYGDNPTARKRGMPSHHQGNWWIGTAENRPSPSHPAGVTQGDTPVGTMTSHPFKIQGTKIKFLIGGGANINTERVELLIGGKVVARATGANNETMTQKVFDVVSYRGQIGQLRVVDGSVNNWSHINLDHVEDSICTE